MRFHFFTGKGRYDPTALVRRIIRKLAQIVQRYHALICGFRLLKYIEGCIAGWHALEYVDVPAQ
jgi:hypothetical protein